MVDMASDFLDRNTPIYRDDVCFFISQSGQCLVSVPLWAQDRISSPLFLAKCCERRLNQGSFVLLCFVLFDLSGLCLASVLSVFLICLLSCIFQVSVECFCCWKCEVIMNVKYAIVNDVLNVNYCTTATDQH